MIVARGGGRRIFRVATANLGTGGRGPYKHCSRKGLTQRGIDTIFLNPAMVVSQGWSALHYVTYHTIVSDSGSHSSRSVIVWLLINLV